MNSSEKGHSFERKISKDLSLWWSSGKDPDIFYRSDSSGSRATIRDKNSNHKLIDQYGDIHASKPEGRPFTDLFCIECKHYKNINIWCMFTNIKTGFFKFYEQNIIDSSKCNKTPLTIIRQNYRPILGVSTYDFCLSVLEGMFKIPIVLSYKHGLGIFKFEDFLKINSKSFKNFLKTIKKKKRF